LKRSKWSPVDVARHYDEWHGRYMQYYGDTIQAHRSNQLDVLHEYILANSGIRDGMRMLDAGCGVCGPSIYFASKKDISIDAVTISKVQAEEADRRIKELKLAGKIHVHQGDYHKLEELFEKDLFDRILFLESYGHASDQQKVLAASIGVLKPGGFLYIKDYFKKELSPDPEKAKLMKIGLKNMNRVYRYNAADLCLTISCLRKLRMELVWVKRPEFVWDNTRTVNDFESALGIDLFEGHDRPQIVEPFELLFHKPA
jgi:2-polyprenyl-3-methyl-5-hydroxy-6-metoxy-1,4-benzoquinol methylase